MCISCFMQIFQAASIDFGMEPLKEFAVTTSVKGLPRLVKSRSRPVRLLWTVSINGFLAIEILQATVLTIDYLNYGTTTTSVEYRTDLRCFTKNRVYLPDVSLCNTNPFGGQASMVQDVPTLKEFYDQVMNVTSCHNCSFSHMHSLEHLRKSLLTPAAYSVFIGPDHVRKISHTLEVMLIDCRFILLEGRLMTQAPCFPGTEVIYRYDLSYYNCYTLRLPTPSFAEHVAIGISLVLHLDNYFKEHWMYFDTDIHNRMGGLQLSLHPRNTLPWGELDGVLLPPGFLTNMKVRYQRRRSLKHPHGNCSDDCLVHLFQNRTYTRDYCLAFCVQLHVSKSCGCVDYNIYTELNSFFYQNLTSCFSLHRTREDLLQMHQCTDQQRRVAMEICSSLCFIACDEVSYDVQVGGIYDLHW